MMSKRHFEWRAPVFAAAVVAVLCCGAALAEDLFEGAPAAPPGYENHKQAQLAVMLGKVERVEEPETVPEGLVFHDDLEFAAPEGKPLTLDLYVPEDAETPPPVMLFIHGGGWSKGNKEDYAFYNIAFAKRGYATASTQYRLSPEYHFPAAIQDVKCAIVWLKTHAEAYGFDASRMVLIGGSAGGHLSLLAGYSQDPALECPDTPEGVDTRVQGIVNIYGVVDCTTPVAQEAHQVNDFIGKPYSEAADMYALSSPIHHLDKDDPPTLTFHGTIDELVPVSQADTLHQKLDKLGVVNYYDRIEGWPHSMDVAKPINDRCRYIVARFLEKHLPLNP